MSTEIALLCLFKNTGMAYSIYLTKRKITIKFEFEFEFEFELRFEL